MKGSVHLRYRARLRRYDREFRPWYIDVRKLWGLKSWTEPMWVGPFRTAAGAVALKLNEEEG